MTTITFDSVTLQNPSPLNPKIEGTEVFELTIECQTDDYTDISNITGKASACKSYRLLSKKTKVLNEGTSGTLAISGFGGALDGNYTNCAIEGGIQVTEVEGTGGLIWKYKMKFVRDTTS